jgi:predicted nucleic acid-binding protein
MNGLTLDTGALIALERGDRQVAKLLRIAALAKMAITIPTGALGQAWRDGARHAILARFLNSSSVTLEPLTDERARAAGQLCGTSGTHDVIDASVALSARSRRDKVLTSDPKDIERLDSSLDIIAV